MLQAIRMSNGLGGRPDSASLLTGAPSDVPPTDVIEYSPPALHLAALTMAALTMAALTMATTTTSLLALQVFREREWDVDGGRIHAYRFAAGWRQRCAGGVSGSGVSVSGVRCGCGGRQAWGRTG